MEKTLIGPPGKDSRWIFLFFPGLGRYPRYQRIIGHMPNARDIFCLLHRLYGPVRYFFFIADWDSGCYRQFAINYCAEHAFNAKRFSLATGHFGNG